MLRFLQSLNGSFIVKFLLILIGLSFIGWEFGTGFVRSSGGTVLTVNSQKVASQTFQQELSGRLNQIRERLGDSYNPALFAHIDIAGNILNERIQQLVLLDFAQTHNLKVTPLEVAKSITDIPAFQDDVIGFSSLQYQAALRNLGLTAPQFEALVEKDLLAGLARAPFTNIEFTNEAEIKRLANVLSESRTVRILRVIKNDVEAPQAPSEQDLLTLYEDMQSTLRTPERRTFTLINFDKSDFMQQVAVTDDEISNYFNQYKDTFGEPEGRKVQHILFKSMEKAEEAAKELEEGTPFDQVAKDYSQDRLTAENGGDLGVIYPGDMLPAFDEAAFALDIGEISAPVESSFGIHLITVSEIIEGEGQTLKEAYQEIKTTLRQEKALNALYDAVEEADEMLAGGMRIQEVALTLNTEPKNFTVDPSGLLPNGAPAPIPGNTAQILDQVFTMDTGIPSTPINMGENTQGFIEVTDIQPSKQQDFKDVQDKLKEAYEKEMYEREVLAKATKILTERLQGHSFENLAKTHNLEAPIQTFVDITRAEKAKSPLINDAVQQELVAMKAGDVLEQVIPTKQGAALYEVIEVHAGEPDDAALRHAENRLNEDFSENLFQQFITNLQNNAKIEINQDELAVIKKRVIPTN